MHGKKDVIVSTTSTLEGWEIEKYIKPISSHLVAGTNLFGDFFASFTDVFGGRSQTYQRQMATLYNEAIEELKVGAFELGANCIVGLKVDMDEISGKGKSMFMITATGTAVFAKNAGRNLNSQVHNNIVENVSLDKLINLKNKKTVIDSANTNQLTLDENVWTFIIENGVHEIFNYVLSKWKELLKSEINQDAAAKFNPKMKMYVASFPPELRYELVYKSLVEEQEDLAATSISHLIKDLEMLDLDLIETYLNSDVFQKQKRSLIPLLFHKSFYNKQDVIKLKELEEKIKLVFTERGNRTMKKQLLSSKEKEVWNCECGKQNDIDSYCSGCYKDIMGFKSTEVKPAQAISQIQSKIELITESLNSN